MRVKGSLRGALLYGIATLGMLAPLVRVMDRALPELSDSLLNAWIMAWSAQILPRDPGRWFDAPPFFPYRNTLAFSEHLLGLSLIAAPLNLATGNPILAYNFTLLFLTWWAAMGMYHLVRRLVRKEGAAWLAGLLYAFSPYRAAQIAHLHLLAAAWLPVVLAAALDYGRRPTPRTGALLFLALAMAALSSWHVALFAAALMGLYGICAGVAGRIPRKAFMGFLAIGAGLAALLGPIVRPYWENRDLHVAFRWRSPQEVNSPGFFSARPTDFLAAAPWMRVAGPLTAPFRARPGSTPEHYLYPGLLGLGLALVGGWRRRDLPASARPAVWALVLAIGVGVGLSLGPVVELGGRSWETPYGLLLEKIPAGVWMRVPARWFTLATVGLAALGGIGAARCIYALPSPTLRRLVGGAMALGILGEGAFQLTPGFVPSLPPVYRWLARQPGSFAVLELPMHVAPDPEYPEAWRMYASLYHGKRLVNGYSGLTPPFTQAVGAQMRAFPDPATAPALARLGELGVRLVLVDRQAYGDRLCEMRRLPILHPLYMDERTIAFEIRTFPGAQTAIPEAAWQPLPADFGGALELLAYAIAPDPPRLFLRWRVRAPGRSDLSVAVHFLNARGEVVAQADGPPPFSEPMGFACWPAGAEIQEVRFFPGEPARWAEVRRIRIGVYEWATGRRLPLTQGGALRPDPFLTVAVP